MSALLTVLLPALVPAITDGIRGLIARVTGGSGSQPQNVAEAIQLMQAQTARLQALAQLDQASPNVSRWVADLRGAFRYVAVGVIELAAIAVAFTPEVGPATANVIFELAGAGMSFIIGERMYLHLKASK